MTSLRVRSFGLCCSLLIGACGSSAGSNQSMGSSLAPGPISSPRNESGIPHRTLDPDSPYETTPEEYALRLKGCLGDRGFNVEIDPYDYHLSGNVGSEGRVNELQVAASECRAAIDPTRNEPPPPPTEEQLRALYRYYVAQADCLVAAGYPAASAPPEQVYVDNGGQWDPRLGLEDVDIPQTVTRACEEVEGRPTFLDW